MEALCHFSVYLLRHFQYYGKSNKRKGYRKEREGAVVFIQVPATKDFKLIKFYTVILNFGSLVLFNF